MVSVESTMLPIGTKAPDFALPGTDGNTVSRSDFVGQPLLVMFICNHCPYVKHVRPELAKIGRDYAAKGVAVVAISANDVANHPEDSPEKMREEKAAAGYTFPYLYDESQETAKAYTAACTPDFFLFDAEHKLYYRGRLDESRPKNDTPLSGADLRAALDSVLAGNPPPDIQRPSMGCNIKWKEGNAPYYFKVG